MGMCPSFSPVDSWVDLPHVYGKSGFMVPTPALPTLLSYTSDLVKLYLMDSTHPRPRHFAGSLGGMFGHVAQAQQGHEDIL
jgi:hypothetical protein